jgi:hypothetical protein
MCWERFLPLPWQTRMTTTSLLHNPPERHQGGEQCPLLSVFRSASSWYAFWFALRCGYGV